MSGGHTKHPIAVGLITSGDIRVEYAQSLIGMWQNDIAADWIVIPSGPYLDVGRNKVVDQFLIMNDERVADDLPPFHGLLMTDSDVAWEPSAATVIVELADAYHLEHGVWPVLGGAYLGVMPGGNFVVSYVYDVPGLNPDPDIQSMGPIPLTRINEPDCPMLVPVDGTGTGFMYIPTLILEHFREFYDPPSVWFADDIIGKSWFGEDLMFCKRAADIGHPTFLCRDVRLQHYKTMGLVFPDPPTASTRE